MNKGDESNWSDEDKLAYLPLGVDTPDDLEEIRKILSK